MTWTSKVSKRTKSLIKNYKKVIKLYFFLHQIIFLYRLMNLLILNEAKCWNSSKPFWEYLFIMLPIPFFWNSGDACPGMDVVSWYKGNIFTLSCNTHLVFGVTRLWMVKWGIPGLWAQIVWCTWPESPSHTRVVFHHHSPSRSFSLTLGPLSLPCITLMVCPWSLPYLEGYPWVLNWCPFSAW